MSYNYAIKEMRQTKNEDKLPCERCGQPYDETKRGGGIDVHHLDHDRTNNELSNLVILCRKCHMQEHHGSKTLTDEHKAKISESQRARHARKRDDN